MRVGLAIPLAVVLSGGAPWSPAEVPLPRPTTGSPVEAVVPPDDPCAGPGRVEGPLAERLDARLRDAVDRGFSGSAVVEKNGVAILCRGYGWTDARRAHPVEPATRFEIASITKQFTAAAVLLLVDEGALSLSDSLGRLLPGLDPPKSGITIHQLLSHSAGLGHNYAMDGIAPRGAAIDAILDPPLDYPPGEGFGYTNNAYALLAAIVEIVSDQSYESFLTRRLLEPAGMDGTTFWGLVDATDPLRFAQILEPTLGPELLSPNWGLRGSGGIWSSARDLYRWYRSTWRGPLLGEDGGERLFEVRTTSGSGLGIGYGSFVSRRDDGTVERWARGTEDFGHEGVLRWFPDRDLFVLVLSNSGKIDQEYAHVAISDEMVGIACAEDGEP